MRGRRVSSLRIKIERERLEKLEAAAKGGPAPRVFMPEQSTTDTGRNLAAARLAAEDAAIPALRRTSGDVRARVGQPRTAPDDTITIALSPAAVLLHKGQVEWQRQNAVADKAREVEQARQRVAQAERQRLAAAEAERLRQAGVEFERETARLAIEDATGKLTLAEFDIVERIVLSQYPAGISDPNIWRLAANEYRDNIRVRKLWVLAPYNVINESTDEQLAVMFETSVDTIRTIRAEEL